jgi:hypothetical protein
VFAQISPNTQIETHVPTTTTPDLEDGDEVEEDTDTIVVAGQTITEGGVIEILSRNGNTVRYRVLDIIQGDGSPNRITLQSIDGRNLKTYKDIRSLEQNPSQFRVITR